MKVFIMKRIVVVFSLILAANIYAGDAGRFQLFSGTIRTFDAASMPVVLKIDTQTGITWELSTAAVEKEGIPKGAVTMTGWTLVTEDLIGDLKKFQGTPAATPIPKASSAKTP